jgi:hypothetical protein
MATAAAAWVTWAAWADIDPSKQLEEPRNSERGGKQFRPRFFIFATETLKLKIEFSLRLCVSVAILDLTDPVN